jgi:hypothetical protein
MGFGPSPDTWRVTSLEASHYDTALNQHAIDIEDLGALSTPMVIVSRVIVWSDQNLDWDIAFFRNNTSQPDNSPLEDHGLFDLVSFVVADGLQIAGTGPFIYVRSNLEVRYFTEEQRAVIGLINRNAAAKNAGATGNVRIEISGPVL